MLSSFHAWFSLGNLAGALAGSLLLGLGMGLWTNLMGILALSLLTVGVCALRLLPRQRDNQGQTAAPTAPGTPAPWNQRFRLSPVVASMGLLCFLAMLGEGATGDWSGLYFRDMLAATGGLVGLGYIAFTLAMTLGRAFGDRWRSRYGAALVIAGALLSGLGMLLAVVSTSPLMAGVGYALTGLGAANIVPVLYGAAGQAMNVQGIAQVATLGYLGFLAGPPLIGYVSHMLGPMPVS